MLPCSVMLPALRSLTLQRPTVFRLLVANYCDDAPVEGMKNPFEKEKQLCILCKHNIAPDYKNVRLLSQFQSPYTGRVYGKHITGLCSTQQKLVEEEITKAQSAGLMPYYLKTPSFLKDPKLFNPDRPFKPHRF